MPRLLLLHGFSGAPSSWQAVINSLPQAIKCVVPSLVGHGDPPVGAEVDNFDAEIDRLAALVPEADPAEPTTIAGYSLGARLALGALVRYPKRFHGAVLVSANVGLANELERNERRARDHAWGCILEQEGLSTFVDRWQAEPLFASQRALPTAMRHAERERRLSHTASGLVHSLRATGLAEMPNYRPRLGDVRVPVELLAGSLDERFCRLGHTISSELPRSSFSEVSGAGHNLLLERPDAVAEVIRRVMAQ